MMFSRLARPDLSMVTTPPSTTCTGGKHKRMDYSRGASPVTGFRGFRGVLHKSQGVGGFRGVLHMSQGLGGFRGALHMSQGIGGFRGFRGVLHMSLHP
jgi:hypothetical protein